MHSQGPQRTDALHDHAQGIEPGCQFCDLDLLLRVLVARSSTEIVARYVAVEVSVIRRGRRGPGVA